MLQSYSEQMYHGASLADVYCMCVFSTKHQPATLSIFSSLLALAFPAAMELKSFRYSCVGLELCKITDANTPYVIYAEYTAHCKHYIHKNMSFSIMSTRRCRYLCTVKHARQTACSFQKEVFVSGLVYGSH